MTTTSDKQEIVRLTARLTEAEEALTRIANLTMSGFISSLHLCNERARIAREYLYKHEEKEE